MTRRPVRIAAGLALAVVLGCSALQAAPPGGTASASDFVFAALGDTPYTRDEESRFIAMIARLNREQLAFVVHVGDLKSGSSPCSDALFLQRKAWFALSHHPFVFVPGDNDWTDCHRISAGGYAPLERLDKLRELFFRDEADSDQRKLNVLRQSAVSPSRPYPEHMLWVYRRVLFVTLNVPGGNNNSHRMPGESRERSAAVRDWIRRAFNSARQQKLRGIVVMMQANPWTASGKQRRGYSGLLGLLAGETLRFDGEVLLIHGDTHRFRVDRPLRNPDTRLPIENFMRVEVFGSPVVNWVRVSVGQEKGKPEFHATSGSGER